MTASLLQLLWLAYLARMLQFGYSISDSITTWNSDIYPLLPHTLYA